MTGLTSNALLSLTEIDPVAMFCPKIEAIVIEVNLKKRKWLLIGTYNPHKSMIKSNLDSISMQFDELHKKYENILIIGDFNSEFSEEAMNEFCCLYNLKTLIHSRHALKTLYNLKTLIHKPTCFKNPLQP